MMVSMASSNTILQTIAEEDKRGRLMSLYTMGLRRGRAFLAACWQARCRPASAHGHAHHRRLCVPGRRGLVRTAVAPTAGVGSGRFYSQRAFSLPWPLVVGRKRGHVAPTREG